MSLVSDANYLYYLGLGQSESITNNLTPIIGAAEAKVKQFLNRDLESATYTAEKYDGSGTNELILRQSPVTTLTSVARYDGLDSNNDEVWTTLVLGTDYERAMIPAEANRIILDYYEFELGCQNYRVTYVAGYSTIPLDIQLACKELVALYWRSSPPNNNFIGVQNISDAGGGASSTINIDLEAEQKILNKIVHYKVVNV